MVDCQSRRYTRRWHKSLLRDYFWGVCCRVSHWAGRTGCELLPTYLSRCRNSRHHDRYSRHDVSHARHYDIETPVLLFMLLVVTWFLWMLSTISCGMMTGISGMMHKKDKQHISNYTFSCILSTLSDIFVDNSPIFVIWDGNMLNIRTNSALSRLFLDVSLLILVSIAERG